MGWALTRRTIDRDADPVDAETAAREAKTRRLAAFDAFIKAYEVEHGVITDEEIDVA